MIHLRTADAAVLHPYIVSTYLAVYSTHTTVGRFRSLVRRSGTRCLTNSEIRRMVLTVLNSFLRQSSLISTNVTSAEVFLNDMRYMSPRFTYLLTYKSGRSRIIQRATC